MPGLALQALLLAVQAVVPALVLALVLGPALPRAAVIDQVVCPAECFCLSKSEVLCNTGGLSKIPLEELPASVQHLSLHRNSFSHIKTEAFAGLRMLSNLSLDHNNITTIKPFAFRGLPRLRELSIQHTPLAVISSFSFAGLQGVEVIKLCHNRIHRVAAEAFAGTSNIKWLVLDKNPLKVVQAKAFSGLTVVKHFILPSGLGTIEPDAFNGMDHVGLFRLAYMDLVSLDAHTFRGLRHVHLLLVQDSDLGVVRARVFEGLAHVLDIAIKNNKIDALEEFHLLHANQVKNLRFEGNHLLQNPAPGSVVIQIGGNLSVSKNHFPCDCRLHGVLAGPLARQSSLDFRAHNFCIKPLHANGQTMSAMDAVDAAALARCPEAALVRSSTEATHG
ncbi:hypothetical protein FOCC_FOCC005797, partial [Frankliniella occidentalis]